MTATATTTLHQPWCTEHVDPEPGAWPNGWCASRTETHDVDIELLSDVEQLGGEVWIQVYARSETVLTPTQAREVAAALVAAAVTLERA